VRVALIAGNNLGHEPERKLRYAEEEVQRFSELLKSKGDFEKVIVLQGASRREIEGGLLQIRRQLDEAKSAGHQTLFVFFYSGHGNNEALEIGSERLPLRDLRNFLEQLNSADVRVAFVDACQSGALTGVKGGKRAPGYEVRLADPGQVKGMAIVTSSTANEFSQESDELKGSYFSHSIMSGLLGAADSSRDGQVTLSEVYQFAFRRTLASTAASLAGGQHPTYDYRMAGAGDVILTRTRPKDARLAFVRESGATYTIFSGGRGEVIAELPSSASEDLYLALPAGDYRVVRRTLGHIKERTLALNADTSTTVEPLSMSDVAQTSPRRKGGILELQNSLGAFVGMGTSMLPGTRDYLGMLALSYMRDLSWIALRGRVSASSFDSNTETLSSKLTRMGASLDALYPILDGNWVAVGLGPSVGFTVTRQKDLAGKDWPSYGFTYAGAMLLTLRVTSNSYLAVNLDGGAEVLRYNGVRTQRGIASGLVGGIVSF
jgi:hypothetical protein